MQSASFILILLSVVVSYNFIKAQDAEATADPSSATAAPGITPNPDAGAAEGGGTTDSAAGSTAVPCPEECKKITKFTCGDWQEPSATTNNTMWNFSGRSCKLTTTGRSWMLARSCTPFPSQMNRIFWTEDECTSTCAPCIKY